MPKRAAPIEYLLDMYVDGRLEDAANEEHLPGAGSVKEQANAAAVKLAAGEGDAGCMRWGLCDTNPNEK